MYAEGFSVSFFPFIFDIGVAVAVTLGVLGLKVKFIYLVTYLVLKYIQT